ncbi:unnamed protein product [Diamesa hyperborea]
MAQNVQIANTFIVNSDSVQIDDLSLPMNEITIMKRTPKRSASDTFTTPNPSINLEIANKLTITGSKTPQRSLSDTFTSPNPSVKDENKLLKSTPSSKIPTMRKSLVITPTTEATTGLNLRSRIGPNRKSLLPIAKPVVKSVTKPTTAKPRIALKSIGNNDSAPRPTQIKKFYSTSTPTLAPANRTSMKLFSDKEDVKLKRYTLSNIDITGIQSDGDDQLVDAKIQKSSVIKN